mgnify:CR=1 FL=1
MISAFIPSNADRARQKNQIKVMAEGRAIEWFIETEPANSHLDERFTLWAAVDLAQTKRMTFAVASIKGLTEKRYQSLALLEEIAALGIEIEVADDPEMNAATVEVLSAQAMLTRNKIIERSKESLDRIKKRLEETGEYTSRSGRKIKKLGASIGQDALSEAGRAERKKRTDAHALETYGLIEPLVQRGVSQGKIAANLNRQGRTTYTGKRFTQYAVSKLLGKFKK